MVFFAYLGIGAVAGLLAGLFGIGGGTVIVPMLLLLLPQSGVPAEHLMAAALGTSFATIVPTSIASARQHYMLGNVDFSVFRIFVPALMASVFAFGWIASLLPRAVLMKIFAVMMLFLSLKMLLSGRRQEADAENAAPIAAGVQLAAGTVIGALSSFAGIGGGGFIVPFLNSRGFAMRRAIGTSSACGVLLSLGAAASFMLSGQRAEHMPAYSAGFVYLPAFAGIAAASVFTSKIGARLASRLPVPILKKAFAAFLCAVAVSMFFK